MVINTAPVLDKDFNDSPQSGEPRAVHGAILSHLSTRPELRHTEQPHLHTSWEMLSEATEDRIAVTPGHIAIQLLSAEVVVISHKNPELFQTITEVVDAVLARRDQDFETAQRFSQDPQFAAAQWHNVWITVADAAERLCSGTSVRR